MPPEKAPEGALNGARCGGRRTSLQSDILVVEVYVWKRSFFESIEIRLKLRRKHTHNRVGSPALGTGTRKGKPIFQDNPIGPLNADEAPEPNSAIGSLFSQIKLTPTAAHRANLLLDTFQRLLQRLP